MFRKVEDFKQSWEQTRADTLKILDALTDESLSQAVADGHRTIKRVAWHIVQTIPEMMGKTGLTIAGPDEKTAPPSDAASIRAAYAEASESLINQVSETWSDDTLTVTDQLYGLTWPRGLTLFILANHEIHHRGQLTILMRQAGLKVPGVYGPAMEEWVNYGAPAPAV